jgi:hypothetical protein
MVIDFSGITTILCGVSVISRARRSRGYKSAKRQCAEGPRTDSAWLLNNIRVPYVLSRPYTSLRCVWAIGCPSDLKGINQPWPTYLDPDDENLMHHCT